MDSDGYYLKILSENLFWFVSYLSFQHGSLDDQFPQDGRVCVLSVGSAVAGRVLGGQGGCSLTALAFPRASELVAGNMRGGIQGICHGNAALPLVCRQ